MYRFEADKEINIIPFDKKKIPEKFRIKLGNRYYYLEFLYNDIEDYFSLNLYSNNNEPLCYGEVLRYGRPLFTYIESDEAFPEPVIIPYSVQGYEDTITYDNMGETIQLILFDRDLHKGYVK